MRPPTSRRDGPMRMSTLDGLIPVLIAEYVPAADGKSYQVFVDVDMKALRRVVPLMVARKIATSIAGMESLSIRLVEQP